ncbi:MAG: DMT family transporter [Azospirillaceae bacterium]
MPQPRFPIGPPKERPGGPADIRPRRPLRAITFMLASTVLFITMHAVIKFLAETDLDGLDEPLHPLVIAFFRIAFGLLVALPFIWQSGFSIFRTRKATKLALRAAVNVVAMLTHFTALSLAGLDVVTALGFTAPLFATMLGFVLFGERAGWRRWSAIVIGFIGTLIVLRPGLATVGLGEVLVLVSSFAWAIVMIQIKDLGRTEGTATIAAYASIMMAPLALVPALFVWSWPGLTELAILVVVGLLGGSAQLCLTESLKWAETHVVMPFDFARLVWATMLSAMIFAAWPDLWVWVGGAVIFAANTYILVREHQLRRALRLRESVVPPAPSAGNLGAIVRDENDD